MKILVLNYEYPPIGGGGGIISKYISEGLARLGNEVTVVTTFFERREEKGERREEKFNNYKTAEPRRGDIFKPPSKPPPIRGEAQYTVNMQPRRGDILLENEKSNHPSEPRRGDILLNDNPLVGCVETRENLSIIRLNACRKSSFQSNPREMLSWMRITKKFLRSWNETPSFDICMAHFALPGGEVGRWLKKRFNIPYVVISHGHDIPWVHPRQMFFLHLAAYFWVRKICVQSQINFVQTRMMKSNIDRFLGRRHSEKNVVIPNGVDPSVFYPDYSKRPDKLRILFIGRLVIQKDPMTFLRALIIFSRHTRDFEVHILGDGNLRKRMERFILKYGLNENVTFLGKVQEEQMVSEYQSAHLMIAPSLNEGMSISALEALSCGVYLIATRASGYEDMITENANGEFTAFRNPAELAERIIRFYRTRCCKDFMLKEVTSLSKISCWKEICQRYHNAFGLLVK